MADDDSDREDVREGEYDVAITILFTVSRRRLKSPKLSENASSRKSVRHVTRRATK